MYIYIYIYVPQALVLEALHLVEPALDEVVVHDDGGVGLRRRQAGWGRHGALRPEIDVARGEALAVQPIIYINIYTYSFLYKFIHVNIEIFINTQIYPK